jgi:hypothetical protein
VGGEDAGAERLAEVGCGEDFETAPTFITRPIGGGGLPLSPAAAVSSGIGIYIG